MCQNNDKVTLNGLEKKIEEWAEKFKKKMQLRNLTEEEIKFSIKIFLAEKSINEDKELIDILETKKGGLASVMYLRVKSIHTYELTPALAFYLSESGIVDNFGKSTMIINYFQYIAYKNNLKKIGMHEFSNFAFPLGVPKETFWQEMWEENKLRNIFTKEEIEVLQNNCIVPPDNILDYPRAMKSIREIKK